MYGKIFFSIILLISIIELIFLIPRVRQIKEDYGIHLFRTIVTAMVAMAANILIAFSFNPMMANIAYCLYFAAIDWEVFHISSFCAAYTKHKIAFKYLRIPAIIIFAADSVSLFINLYGERFFSIEEYYNRKDVVFYVTKALPLYNVHLILDYVGVATCLIYLFWKLVQSKSFYKYKYLSVSFVIILIIVLNALYMLTDIPLDMSVIFYGVASTMIYFFTENFAPRILISQAMKKTINTMDKGLILFDIDDRCIYVNNFIKKHFRLSAEDCDTHTEMISSITGDKPLRDVYPGGFDYVKPLKNPALKDKHYRLTLDRILGTTGAYLGAYIMVDDITDNYYVLQELEKAKEDADGANAAKSNFLANMSHELRTPLNSLLGMNEMIIREAEDKKLIEYAENIKVAGNSLLSLLNDILDFSKIEAGRMTVVEAEYNIHKILRDCYNFLGRYAKEKGLAYNIVCDENVPKALYGDEMRIRQIVSNFISNAIKYTSRGSVTVKVAFEETDIKQIMLKISVIDTGVGISEENQKILFDAFQRVDETKNRNIEGTGLGLTICRELSALMNGRIEVKSEVGRGSTFTLKIPQVVLESEPVGPFTLESNTVSEKYLVSFIAPDAKILVVDDVPMNLKVVKALLGKTKIYMQLASGGNEAIELCKRERYDLIFMDHMMPSPDGVEAFKEIRKDSLNMNTPVIVLTANAINGVEEEYRNVGFTDYLSKPVRGVDLEKACVQYPPSSKITLNY